MVDADRINRVVSKIVRGLYFHHYNKPMPPNVELNVSDAPIDFEILKKIIIARKGMVGEEGEFIYWFQFVDESIFHSRWALLFYLKNHLTVGTMIRTA